MTTLSSPDFLNKFGIVQTLFECSHGSLGDWGFGAQRAQETHGSAKKKQGASSAGLVSGDPIECGILGLHQCTSLLSGFH